MPWIPLRAVRCLCSSQQVYLQHEGHNLQVMAVMVAVLWYRVCPLLIYWRARLASGLEQICHVLITEDAESLVPTWPPGCSVSL